MQAPSGDHLPALPFFLTARRDMNESPHDSALLAILHETPHDEHDAVCAAWEALTATRQQYLAGFPAGFVARWLRGLLAGWDDDAPLNALPEGGYARQVAFPTAAGEEVRLWCLVSSRAAQTGELIHCHDGVSAPAGSIVQLELTDDGFARALLIASEREKHQA